MIEEKNGFFYILILSLLSMVVTSVWPIVKRIYEQNVSINLVDASLDHFEVNQQQQQQI